MGTPEVGGESVDVFLGSVPVGVIDDPSLASLFCTWLLADYDMAHLLPVEQVLYN